MNLSKAFVLKNALWWTAQPASGSSIITIAWKVRHFGWRWNSVPWYMKLALLVFDRLELRRFKLHATRDEVLSRFGIEADASNEPFFRTGDLHE